MKKIDHLKFSISACTREKRAGEVEGQDYYFLTPDEFREKIRKQEFAEWEEVYPDHFYGTLSSEVERIRRQGKHVVFDVDVKGGLNIKNQYGDDALAIFVRPPSLKELQKRLENRATDDPEKIALRLKKATAELAFEKDFDTVIINDDLRKAKAETIEKVTQFIHQPPSTI
jgi:guanylate kinase